VGGLTGVQPANGVAGVLPEERATQAGARARGWIDPFVGQANE
jgi:hypothetical protein